jgi:hypothetical protein
VGGAAGGIRVREELHRSLVGNRTKREEIARLEVTGELPCLACCVRLCQFGENNCFVLAWIYVKFWVERCAIPDIILPCYTMDLGTYLPSPRLSMIPEESQELEEAAEDAREMRLELEEPAVKLAAGDRDAEYEVTAEIDENGD